jgi:hypothetical protein
MQYELLRAGIYIEIPELKQAMDYLAAKGFSITPKIKSRNSGQSVAPKN